MNKRPTPNDSEKDIILMQQEFLREKDKNPTSFQPAAKIVKYNQGPTCSSFAQKRNIPKQPKKADESNRATEILGDIVERKVEEDGPIGQTIKGSILGDILERKFPANPNVSYERVGSNNAGFPKPIRLQRHTIKQNDDKGKQSLFAMSHAKKQSNDTPQTSPAVNKSMDFGEQSHILSNSTESNRIHRENINLLKHTSPSEIIKERANILNTLDPSLIKFLQSKRKAANVAPVKSEPAVISETVEQKMDVDFDLSTIDLFKDPNISNWHHFSDIETEKLEWMKDIENNLPVLKPGESYEARFDWKGILLPYSSNETDNDRELYLHGDDAQRPGYTLQELFRLARSNVMQQRNAAIGAISGIINIYNQGFYDSVLELPISKIFFLIRFAFDDNTLSLLETSSKALATLFHNDSDEILLDLTYDCSLDFLEPSMGLAVKSQLDESAELSDKLSNINLNKQSSLYQSTLPDEEDNNSNLNDFHLAETDLIECLLRTNILQRIKYIILILKPENSTVTNCLKLLIRLARTNQQIAETLLHYDGLIGGLISNFLPSLGNAIDKPNHFYRKPQFLTLKLFRIIASYGGRLSAEFKRFEIENMLRDYICVRSDMSIDLIKLQIEAFRLTKVVLLLNQTSIYSDLTSTFVYLLDWCYRFITFEDSTHYLFRQYASALIALIGYKKFQCSQISLLPEKFKLCLSKWFHFAKVAGVKEFSQQTLLSTGLNVASRLFGYNLNDFYEQYFKEFILSQSFSDICKNLRAHTPLISSYTNRTSKYESLPTLSSVLFTNQKTPTFIYDEKYSIYLLNSIVNVLALLPRSNVTDTVFQHLLQNQDLSHYLTQISESLNVQLKQNWFVRNELMLWINILKCTEIRSNLDKISLQKIAYNIACYLTENDYDHIVYLFENILFNFELYANTLTVTKEQFEGWRQIYMKICLPPQEMKIPQLLIPNSKELILLYDWPYIPMLTLLSAVTNKVDYFSHHGLHERDIITASLLFTSLQKENSLHFISATEELMFLMISFLGPDATFLEPNVHSLLQIRIGQFFADNKNTLFQLEQDYEGKGKFENLYILFLDHFQGTSYGDELFGSLLMIPLAPKYDIKWRQMVWSEHASVLRFINCSEEMLISGSLDEYLCPPETEESLLKSYYQALHSNMLRTNSIAYRIAQHHLDNYKKNRKM